MEAAFWETVSGAAMFPIAMGIVVFFVVFLALQYQLVERFTGWNSKARVRGTYAALVAGGIAGIAVIYKMWI
jgi:hypothetical protein